MNRFYKLAIPYLIWLIILVVIPLLTMLMLAFGNTIGADFSTYKFTFDNFSLITDFVYVRAFLNSIKIAGITTLFCLVIGYSLAYAISTSKIKNKNLILLLLILPMWSNILLRIVALENVFSSVSILNSFGIPTMDLKGTEFAVIFGCVTCYLPFMVFPIFTTLEKMDLSLLEASNDLGVDKIKSLFKVTVPLSMKGVVSGVIMVFLPSATGFLVPKRLGAGNISMIGDIIERQFKTASNYNLGALLSLCIVFVILLAVLLLSKVDKDGETL